MPGGSARAGRGRRWRVLAVAGAVAALLAAATGGGFIGHALATGTPTASAGGLPRNRPGGFPFGGFGGFGQGQPNGSGGAPFGGGAAGGGASRSSGAGPSDASAIASRVSPGLVDVNTTIDYGQAQGAGTGMVLTRGGEVLTNNHVIEGATAISVTDVGNHRTYAATVLGYSVSNDVAVLKLSGASGLRTVTTAAAAPSSGEEVVAVGNAGGAGGTPSYAGGTVTATGQSITARDDITGTAERLTGMIETNADVQAGDSGGPLVNASGRVIGMDTAGSDTFQFAAQSQGDGFAIPITTASTVASHIAAGASSATVHIGPTAFLGVQIGSQGQGGFAPGGYGYGNGPASGNGVTIAGVVPGSPASGTGLTAGDTITAIDSHAVTSQSSLQTVMVRDYRPGQTAAIHYTDTTGQSHTATVVLASGPPA
jgi:S1-C subfamily serine protease